jgi:hypothetical protein
MIVVVIFFHSFKRSELWFEILGLSDIMTLNLFYLVKDFGSWLEIGNSISRFGLLNLQIVVQLILFAFGRIYIKKNKN